MIALLLSWYQAQGRYLYEGINVSETSSSRPNIKLILSKNANLSIDELNLCINLYLFVNSVDHLHLLQVFAHMGAFI